MAYLPILTYHRILKETPTTSADPHRISVSETQFRSHVQWLQRLGYRGVGLNAYGAMLRAGEAPARRSVAITFDDGYEEVLTVALPILQAAGFSATVFCVPGQLGGCNAWDHGQARLLTGDQIRGLRKSGVDIGAHTCSHVHLSQVPAETARREMADSKKELETLLGEPVPMLAYPYGESNPAVESLAREAGFEAAFATDRAPRNHAENLFRIRRVVIFPSTNLWQLLWKAQRWYPAYQDFKRR